jgi:hypothetical protein
MARTLVGRAKADLWERAGKKCEACGLKIDTFLDGVPGHKKAYSLGGQTTFSNLVFLCHPCNIKQRTIGWKPFIIKYYYINQKKYKSAYIKLAKEVKNKEIDKIKKKIDIAKDFIRTSKSEIRKKKALAYIEKGKIALSKVEEKFKKIIPR